MDIILWYGVQNIKKLVNIVLQKGVKNVFIILNKKSLLVCHQDILEKGDLVLFVEEFQMIEIYGVMVVVVGYDFDYINIYLYQNVLIELLK